jgi:hypothetical protein
MREIVFRVRQVPGGWIVQGDEPDVRTQSADRVGSITDKANALDLAHGMASAIRQTGGQARVIVDA